MNDPVVGGENGAEPRGTSMTAWAIGPAFGLLAAWFLVSSPRAAMPLHSQPPVERALFSPGARRTPMSDPPSVVVGGFSHVCNECHKLFDSPPVERRILTQHTGITFDHGMNNRCFNCHDRHNRERLVLHDGSLVGFDEVPRLCSQCHGTVYRDWQAGSHGKTMGSWDVHTTGQYAQHRLNCNDCHDPHAPAYRPIRPLPGPNTLRMGDQSPHEDAPGHQRHVPLRRWSMPDGEHAAPTERPTAEAPSTGHPAPEAAPTAVKKEERP